MPDVENEESVRGGGSRKKVFIRPPID